jgi:hypothetical protein
MPNHVHLVLLETGTTPLAKFKQESNNLHSVFRNYIFRNRGNYRAEL